MYMGWCVLASCQIEHCHLIPLSTSVLSMSAPMSPSLSNNMLCCHLIRLAQPITGQYVCACLSIMRDYDIKIHCFFFLSLWLISPSSFSYLLLQCTWLPLPQCPLRLSTFQQVFPDRLPLLDLFFPISNDSFTPMVQ